MKNKWLTILIIITLILGIFFRFANLDKKVYSSDEVRKIYRIAGYTSEQFKGQLFTGKIISVEEIQNYQKLSPEKSWNDTFNSLAGNSEHPPLYYIFTRLFMQVFNQPITARLTSILFSLLLFPAVFWLCTELFSSSVFGWISISLLAISPVQINAAQNASQYSLWMLITALSSVALLKALRLNNRNNWLLYTFSLIAGFYTHLYFVTVFFTHLVYIFILEKFRFSKKLINYLLFCSISFLAFLPWVIIIINRSGEIKQNIGYYEKVNTSLKNILTRLLNNIANNFIDFHNTSRIENYLDYLILAIILYSLYILIRKEAQKTWLFILLLILITPLVHILPNFISPSARTLQARYYLPCYLGIEIAVSYAISYLISTINLPKWQSIIGKLMLFITLSLGVISGVFITQINDWGLDDQKGTANGQNIEIASVINKSEEPLIISETAHSFILGLSYLVDEDTKFILLSNKSPEKWQTIINWAQLNQQFKNIYIYFPDQKFVNYLETNNLKLEAEKKGFYKVNSF